jgi:hypothetical protein
MQSIDAEIKSDIKRGPKKNKATLVEEEEEDYQKSKAAVNFSEAGDRLDALPVETLCIVYGLQAKPEHNGKRVNTTVTPP